MSELFTQNYSDKPLFHTDTDISESLHNQVDEASNGEELLNNTEKQAESLLSNDDYVSETKDTMPDFKEALFMKRVLPDHSMRMVCVASLRL